MKPATDGATASANITNRIQELGDWRGQTLAHLRQLIHEADPDIEEEWKWMGTPVWSHDGIVCTGESYKQVVKLTFARGASIQDPKKLFNSSLEGNTRRAIDLRVFPSRLELKSFFGLLIEAPRAKVSFTTCLYDSPVQTIPSWDQTGVPIHFHSSWMSGSASWMS